MSNAQILEFEDLQRITGYSRRSDVERTMRAQGIKLFLGRKGPWTTIDLVNSAGGIQQTQQPDSYSPDILG
ncbi:hypothetical protein [Pseudomonas sp. zfem005]|uniref:hypothetical protein n=1 Tax=Pseudomonas sp. zfem005 TaxID=3078200 RepID=UPI0029286E94|nr:hypothetical protein [Pseudomonas sp. zfem005]MDU9416204.1 hypothetical protein [Pseudomonas sp. zfem005]